MGIERDMRVLIVGGGIGGLTTGIALRQAGIEATVFERAADTSKIQLGGAIVLWTNAMRALRRIGLDEPIESIGSLMELQEFLTAYGELLGAWPLSEVAREYGASNYATRRPDLHGVLMNAIGENAIQFGAEYVGFTQDTTGVTVRFANGREERGNILIGADGLRSSIRTQLLGTGAPKYQGYTGWLGYSDYEGSPPGTFRFYFGRGQRVITFKIRERTFWLCIVNAPEDAKAPQEGAQTMLLDRFGYWADPIPALITTTEPGSITKLSGYDRDPVDNWTRGRVTLLGDAAHPMSFNLGQGACQAIEDAVVMADCLQQSNSAIEALRVYSDLRTRRTAPVIKEARRIGLFGTVETPLLVEARNRFLRFSITGPALKTFRQNMSYKI